MDNQSGEESELTGAAQLDVAAVDHDADRSEHTDVHNHRMLDRRRARTTRR